MPKSKDDVNTRFWNKVNILSPDECWEWKASKFIHGYGNFYYFRKHVHAHRVSWMLTHGNIEKGLYVLHKCDNRACVNPNHLFLGTHQDNMDDMVTKGRHKPTYTGNGLYPSLSFDHVKEIRQLYNTGKYRLREIAEMFNTSESHVWRIAKNLTRKEN
jgi:hypothetical protein